MGWLFSRQAAGARNGGGLIHKREGRGKDAMDDGYK
jgi:hypothetical protein